MASYREEKRAYERQYYKENAAKLRAYSREYSKTHREQIKAQRRQRHKQKQLKRVRDEKICRLYLVGHTLKDIGVKFGLTDEGCRQVVKKAGIQTTRAVKGIAVNAHPSKLLAKGIIIKRIRQVESKRSYMPGEWPTEPAHRGVGGYLYRWIPLHPNANCGGRVAQHRLVMEQQLGRYLKPKERVHHINGDRADNRRENLTLFKNCGYHMQFHKNNAVD